ncbi:MAG: hypothetical protein ACYSWO_07265 [Planctomycetota bacterium]|jgi:hypothetical protein
MMRGKKVLKVVHLHPIWVAALFAFAIWLMSVLKCEMATPAY